MYPTFCPDDICYNPVQYQNGCYLNYSVSNFLSMIFELFWTILQLSVHDICYNPVECRVAAVISLFMFHAPWHYPGNALHHLAYSITALAARGHLSSAETP